MCCSRIYMQVSILSTLLCHPPYPPEFNYLCGLLIEM